VVVGSKRYRDTMDQKAKVITPTERLELSTLRSRRFVKVSRASQLCHAGWSGYVIGGACIEYNSYKIRRSTSTARLHTQRTSAVITPRSICKTDEHRYPRKHQISRLAIHRPRQPILCGLTPTLTLFEMQLLFRNSLSRTRTNIRLC
jgi:hypothetical protein